MIPADLPGKVFLQASTDDPDSLIYIANPDGSNKQEIGHVWEFQSISTSLNGSQMLFSREDGLYFENIATGEIRHIPDTVASDIGALWSPDGTHIAFLRAESPTSLPNIYIINPDGTGVQRITKQTGDYYLFGWHPDSSTLLFAELTRAGYTLKKLELASGTISDLFTPKGGHISAIAPDGNEVVFQEQIDEKTMGLYISHLDGSERRLIKSAALSMSQITWSFSNVTWSPDGKWLAIAISKKTANAWDDKTVLVNLATCQIVPLPYKDYVLGWTR